MHDYDTPQFKTKASSHGYHGLKQVKSIAERFWEKVHKTETCWFWVGSRSAKGYGFLGCCAVHNFKLLRASRVSWEIHFGEIPPSRYVLHHCDNPPCVRPDHLFLGTNSDNQRDSVRKGRHGSITKPQRTARGERLPQSRLTEKKVIEMRKRYLAGGVTYQELGEAYGVGHVTALRAVTGVSWAKLPGALVLLKEHWAKRHPDRIRTGWHHNPSTRAKHISSAILTEGNVREIRHRYEAGESQKTLATEFGVAPMTVNRIVRYRTWTHIL